MYEAVTYGGEETAMVDLNTEKNASGCRYGLRECRAPATQHSMPLAFFSVFS